MAPEEEVEDVPAGRRRAGRLASKKRMRGAVAEPGTERMRDNVAVPVAITVTGPGRRAVPL